MTFCTMDSLFSITSMDTQIEYWNQKINYLQNSPLILWYAQEQKESKPMLPAHVKRPFSMLHAFRLSALVFLTSSQGFSEQSLVELENRAGRSDKATYRNFTNNPRLTKCMKRFIAPHLLPEDHPAKTAMDEIFAKSGVIRNEKTVQKAGFKIFKSQKKSFIRVLKHPLLEGYLLKVYLDTENNIPRGSPGWKRLTMRCVVAKKIKEIIERHNIKRFIVADKWVYPLPQSKSTPRSAQPLVLLVKDMQIFNTRDSKKAWMKKAGYRTVRELYTIFSRGYGSAFLAGNLPYTHSGKFAFIDTEFGKRHLPMDRLQRHFAPNVRRYWQSLLHRRSKGCEMPFPGTQVFTMAPHREQTELPMEVN